MRLYNQISGQNVLRMEVLSDGVFAIAITLLILDVRVPLQEKIVVEKDLVIQFYKLAPKLLTYFLSFMTLGIFWTAHATQFQFIEKSDRNLNWLNLSFLLFVTLIPFTTAFLSEFISFRFAVAVYWTNLLFLGIMLGKIQRYADRHNYLKRDEPAKVDIKKAMMRRGVLAQSLYFIGALCALINTFLSITILVMVQLYFVLALFPKPFSKKGHSNKK